MKRKIAMNSKYYFKIEKSQFKQFDEDTIAELISLYATSANTVKQIAEMHDLSAGNFYRDLPYELTDKKCSICSEPFYQKVSQRSSKYLEYWLCIACGHDQTGNCSCTSCSKKRAEKLELDKIEFYKQWHKYFDENFMTNISVSDLNLTDLIYLKFILIFARPEDEKTISPNEFSLDRLNVDYDSRLLLQKELRSKIEEFIDRKIFIPQRDVKLSFYSYEIFMLNFNLYYLDELNLNVVNPKTNHLFSLDEYKAYINEKQYTSAELYVLKREVYDYLIKEYTFSLSDKSLKSKLTEITIDSFLDDLFNNFSISKAINIIYYAVSSTIYNMNKYKYSDENKVNTHFRNRVIESIEKHKNDQSLLKDFDLPNTIRLRFIDHFVLDFVLKNKRSYMYERMG